MQQFVAGFVALGVAVVGASIVYQVVNGKNSVPLANTGEKAIVGVAQLLFK